MAATGLNQTRLADTIKQRLQQDLGAKATDADGKPTALYQIAKIIAEEVIKELKQAIVTVYIPENQVLINVTGGANAPAVGIQNSTPIQADNRVSGGLS